MNGETLRTRLPAAALVLLFTAACTTAGPATTDAYTMPRDPALARAPGQADPEHPGELAESALYLLHADKPGGPDYVGAARVCLIAAELADARSEAPLRLACYRTAARSALRAGARDLYVEAVDHWQAEAPRHERASGELSVHVAIRDRLAGRPSRAARLPGEARRLIPPADPVESGTSGYPRRR